MKKLILLVALAALVSTAAPSQDTSSNGLTLPTGETTDAYNKTIENRADGILKPLALTDPAKMIRVHDIIVAQYHALKAWHSENDPKIKSAGKDTNAAAAIRASLKDIHNQFLARLAAELTPDQVDMIKDKMVYNKVQVTYNSYCDIIPVLTAAQKAHILEVLKEAREEAMDGGSVNEKSAIFKKYKGRIANYLAKQGINETQFRKEWFVKFKARTTTNSVPQN
jgi:hypothetical protein